MKSLDKELRDYLTWCAEYYLSIRMRSVYEMSRYLKQKVNKKYRDHKERGFEIVAEILAQFIDEGRLDDQKFLNAWVPDRMYFKPRGVTALKMELYKKGIARDLVETYFQDNPIDESSALGEIIQKRMFMRGILSEKEELKLTRHLLRRGFKLSQIKPALKKAIEDSSHQE